MHEDHAPKEAYVHKTGESSGSVMLAQGWLLHRAPFRDMWRRSWATLSIPPQGPPISILTLRDKEEGQATASLPLHEHCSLSHVVKECAPALLASAIGTPSSLLPQENYCTFSLQWPHTANTPGRSTSIPRGGVSVFIPRGGSCIDIVRALGSDVQVERNQPASNSLLWSLKLAAALSLAILASLLGPVVSKLEEGPINLARADFRTEGSLDMAGFSTWTGSNLLIRLQALLDVLSGVVVKASGKQRVASETCGTAVATLAGCALLLFAIGSSRAWRWWRVWRRHFEGRKGSEHAWRLAANCYHLGEGSTGGVLSSVALGADSMERAEKWRSVFEKAIRLSGCGLPWSPQQRFQQSIPACLTTSLAKQQQGLEFLLAGRQWSFRPPSPSLPAPPPLACAAMLNDADLWLRSGTSQWTPSHLMGGRQVWTVKASSPLPAAPQQRGTHKEIATEGKKRKEAVAEQPRPIVAVKVQDVLDCDSGTALHLLLQRQNVDGTMTLIEHLSDFSDIVHWTPEASLFPPHATGDWKALTLDFCLLRQWRTDPDGSTVLSLESVNHMHCPPPLAASCRGVFHAIVLAVPDSNHRANSPSFSLEGGGVFSHASASSPRRKKRNYGRTSYKSPVTASPRSSVTSVSESLAASADQRNLAQRPDHRSSDQQSIALPSTPATPTANGVGAVSASGRAGGILTDANVETRAGSVAAAAAAAAVAAALPPSCLVIMAGTADYDSGSWAKGEQVGVTAALLLKQLGGLCAAMERTQFTQHTNSGSQRFNSGVNTEEVDSTAALATSAAVRVKKGSRFSRRGRSTNAQQPSAPFSPNSPDEATTCREGGGCVVESDGNDSHSEDAKGLQTEGGDRGETIASTPQCALPQPLWGVADVSGFVVRGPSFTEDRVKIPAGEPLFDLVAVDLWRLDEAPCPNIAAQPGNRVQLARQRGDSTWIFVLQLQVPGPPWFAFVAYFVPKNRAGWDPKVFESSNREHCEGNTPFSRLARPFFFGDDDDYRDDRFKLIPKVVEGNFIVRNAVGTKPTILGRKLKQHYFRGDNYFELDVDIASSAIAQRVVGIAYGYAKLLTIDICCVLQGDSVDELPEQPFAAIRMVGIDFNAAPVHPPLVLPGSNSVLEERGAGRPGDMM